MLQVICERLCSTNGVAYRVLKRIHLVWWNLFGCALHQFMASRHIVLRYRHDLETIRRRCRATKVIDVVFLISEISKWKGQSLYDLMIKSEHYRPVLAVIPRQYEIDAGTECVHQSQMEKIEYFKAHGLNVRSQWDERGRRAIPLDSESCDLVFYQQPWDIPLILQPQEVSRFALTFYFPYFVLSSLPNLETGLEVGQWFHRMLFCYFVFSPTVKGVYEKYIGGGRLRRAVEFVPSGHPMMDNFFLRQPLVDKVGYVIYAPHFSLCFGSYTSILKYATFMWNGREMLDYAKAHPEIKWVFKPHPGLRTALVESGFMTEEEASDYYAEWERIGVSCYTADYVDLFLASSTLITDCGSFLTEYAVTTNPIIHLVNPDSGIKANPAVENLYATYYRVTNLDGLYEKLDEIIIREEDPKRAPRIRAIKSAGLCGTYAAKNIVEYLSKELEVNKWQKK